MVLPEIEFCLIPIDRVPATPGVWLCIPSLLAVQRADRFLDKKVSEGLISRANARERDAQCVFKRGVVAGL